MQKCLLVLRHGENKGSRFCLDVGDARTSRWVFLPDGFDDILVYDHEMMKPKIGLPGFKVLEALDQDVKVD